MKSPVSDISPADTFNRELQSKASFTGFRDLPQRKMNVSLEIELRYGMFSRQLVALNRFKNEVMRVYAVLEIQLSGKYTGEPREYLAGNGKGRYSVADIGTWRK
jgi:hypothetical protein